MISDCTLCFSTKCVSNVCLFYSINGYSDDLIFNISSEVNSYISYTNSSSLLEISWISGDLLDDSFKSSA